MEYTYTALVIYLFFYGFLGWLIESVAVAAAEHTFTNRGFFSLPVCPKYGVVADILLLVLPTIGDRLTVGNICLQLVITLVVVSAADFITGDLVRIIWRRRIWQYEKNTLFGGELKGSTVAVCKAVIAWAVIKLLHPFVFTLFSLIPVFLLRVVAIVLLILLLADLFMMLFIALKYRKQGEPARAEEAKKDIQTSVQGRIGSKLYHLVWRRLAHAYPGMEEGEPQGEYVFAKGVCLDKLIWIFVIWAFAGDLFETVFVGLTTGRWMSRSSVIYGTFSLVWGMGAVILTIIMQRLAQKEDRHVFLAGAFLGGVYEYSCSVISEFFFGRTFWDYSDMPFNINGRTNLLFCAFWGILAVFWVKICYPTVSGGIEKLPPVYAKVVTWAVIVCMIADLLLSGAVLARYVDRTEGIEPANFLEEFIDENYSDSYIESVWPNMRVPGEEPKGQ